MTSYTPFMKDFIGRNLFRDFQNQGYPKLGIYKTRIYKTGDIQNLGYPKLGISKTRDIQNYGYSKLGISKTRDIQDQVYPKLGIYKTKDIQNQEYSKLGISKTREKSGSSKKLKVPKVDIQIRRSDRITFKSGSFHEPG